MLPSDKALQEWELRKLMEEDYPVFFKVCYRTPLSEWKQFLDGRVTTLNKAEKIAQTQSEHYVNSVCRVSVGDGAVVLSLWEDGECIYRDNSLCTHFSDKDYSKVWQ